jgi:hypothetical protein
MSRWLSREQRTEGGSFPKREVPVCEHHHLSYMMVPQIKEDFDMAETESIAEFPFEFYDQLFTIVLGNDRKLYAPIPLMCAALHVQPSGQIQRIQRDPVLVDAMRLVKFEHYPYGDQGELRSREVQALRLDRLPYFLGGIDVSRISNDETKEAVIRFKLEFADRAWAAFRSELLPPDMLAELDTSLSPDQQAYFGMMDRATEIRRDLLAHEGLLKGHEDRIEKNRKRYRDAEGQARFCCHVKQVANASGPENDFSGRQALGEERCVSFICECSWASERFL